jgi:Bacteriophage baseplate protein W
MQLAFPLQFDHRGRTSEHEAARYVRDLIEVVLFTAAGERVMRPDFGSGVAQLLFEPNSSALAGATEVLVQSALVQWLSELISVRAVQVESVESTLRVTVNYTLRGDERPETATFVYAGGPA